MNKKTENKKEFNNYNWSYNCYFNYNKDYRQ